MRISFFKPLPVLFLVVTSAVLFAQTATKTISLEDIFKNRKFSSRGVYGMQSLNDGDHYCQLKKDSLNVYDYESGKFLRTIVTAGALVPPGDSVPIDMGSFEFSDDETKILFADDEEPIYRRSSKANYYILDLGSGKLMPLSGEGKQRLASFSPDGSQVAFVRDNNLFVKDLVSGKEVQFTTDGRTNEIINGATDWVYEEEFEFSKAFAWSPDGNHIAYYRFDERKVREYQLTYYGDLYPEQYKYKYPKAGEDNSLVSIFIYNVKSKITTPVDIGKETDIYIPRIKWTNDPQILALYRMNRHQSRLDLLFADAGTGKSHVVYAEENKQYIEINDHWHFLKDNKGFLLTSEKDGYRHIYLYDMKGNEIRKLTAGNWEVIGIHGVDEESGILYYTSTETSPMDKDLYALGLDGQSKVKLSARAGTNAPEFSKTCKWFINRWSDINTPPYTAVYNAKGAEVRMIQDNAKLKEVMKEYNFSTAEFFNFKTDDNTELHGWMIKPPDFDSLKKYPVIFTIYGGPGSQTVTNSWGTVSSWNQLWAQQGIVVVSVDNRGTGGRGAEFKKCTYLELGKYETLDQIEAAKYLGSLPYIDKTRIGMWGWSFGGYLTLSCLTKGADYFSFGIAVAPVTNWKYYDNIYTERFMRTPLENNQGYEDNSPVNHAGKLKGKLLMIHGMADDNVHPQNAYDMVTALVGANKQFDEQFYPNSNHGIYTGKNTTFHLYTRMTDFILKNL
jgi:dipeptidyl-peptidase-4